MQVARNNLKSIAVKGKIKGRNHHKEQLMNYSISDSVFIQPKNLYPPPLFFILFLQEITA